MNKIPPFSKKAKSVRKGTYQHYKGGYYKVIHIGRNESTLEEVVIYVSKIDSKEIWVRPLDDFLSEVLVNDKSILRFTYIEEVST